MSRLEYILEVKDNKVLKVKYPSTLRKENLIKYLFRKALLSKLRVFEYAVFIKLISSNKASLTQEEECFGMIIILLLSFSRKRRLEWNTFLKKFLSLVREMAGGNIVNEILHTINTSWGEEHFLGKNFEAVAFEGILIIEELKDSRTRSPKRPRTPSAVGTKSSKNRKVLLPEQNENEKPPRLSWEDNMEKAILLVGPLTEVNIARVEEDNPSLKMSDEESMGWLENLKRMVFNVEKT
jgi:hypothetical protein